MSEQDPNKHDGFERSGENEPVILRNEIGKVPDPTVVVDEPGRTVMLTADETIVIEKEPRIDIPPKDRPRKVYKGMWGSVEVGVLGAGLLAVLGAVLLYVFFVAPSNRQIENDRTRRDRLEAELKVSQEKFGNIHNVEAQVGTLINSVNDFEAQYLPIPTNGRTALYQRINGLIASCGLVNSAGPDYAPLEILDQGKENEGEEKGGKAKFRSFFPGVYVSMTVEGPYANLRKFISEVETGGDFVVVSAVELEPSDSQEEKAAEVGPVQAGISQNPGFPGAGGLNAPNGMGGQMPMQAQSGLPNSSRGKTHGAIVSLRIELAAYFRRSNSTPPVETAVQ